MLISYPFLTSRTTEPTDPHTSVPNDVRHLGELTGTGIFPLTQGIEWHGGSHWQSPLVDTRPIPVRAIADGVVVYARASDEMPTSPDALKQHPLWYSTGWTSNGVIILKHATEIGENVEVTYYSIYLHMATLTTRTEKVKEKDAKGKVHETTQERLLATGDKVYRKDPLGMAGSIYDQPNSIHIEIVADRANAALLLGRSAGPLTAPQGRTTCVWGDITIKVPAGTPYYADDPRKATASYKLVAWVSGQRGCDRLADVAAKFYTTPQRLRELNADLVARVRRYYTGLQGRTVTWKEEHWFDYLVGTLQEMEQLPPPDPWMELITVPAIWGDSTCPPGIYPEHWKLWQVPVKGRTQGELRVKLSEAQGTLRITTHDANGKELGKRDESSYDLYSQATTQYPGCPSAGYELLRFGRVLGPDALATSDQYRGRVPHMRKVKLGDQEVFLDLNTAGVQVYSEADFPHWEGWTFIGDDVNVDSRARSKALLDLIDPPAPTPPSATPEQVRQQQHARFARLQALLANANTQD